MATDSFKWVSTMVMMFIKDKTYIEDGVKKGKAQSDLCLNDHFSD